MITYMLVTYCVGANLASYFNFAQLIVAVFEIVSLFLFPQMES